LKAKAQECAGDIIDGLLAMLRTTSSPHEYWDTKKEPSKRSKELGEQGHLGITHIVTAKTKAEAEAKVLRDNPGFVAISEDTSSAFPRFESYEAALSSL